VGDDDHPALCRVASCRSTGRLVRGRTPAEPRGAYEVERMTRSESPTSARGVEPLAGSDAGAARGTRSPWRTCGEAVRRRSMTVRTRAGSGALGRHPDRRPASACSRNEATNCGSGGPSGTAVAQREASRQLQAGRHVPQCAVADASDLVSAVGTSSPATSALCRRAPAPSPAPSPALQRLCRALQHPGGAVCRCRAGSRSGRGRTATGLRGSRRAAAGCTGPPANSSTPARARCAARYHQVPPSITSCGRSAWSR